MRRYPEYKDSGVEWIGEIPKDWSAVPLTKYLESIIDYRGRTPEKTESGRFLVTAKNIRDGQIDYEISQEFTPEDEYQRIMTRGIPQVGDVLFTTEAPLGEVANVDDDSIALAQRIIKFRPKSDLLNPYFLKYWILSHSFQSDLHQYATGSTALGIKASKLCLLKLNLPHLPEQTQIASFLDRKTQQIDELIRIKERKIELLQEQRTALINQAVTKGLAPNVEMKPSGVEWIGEIPEHWNLKRLRFITCTGTQNGLYKSKEHYNDNGIPIISMSEAFQSPVIDSLAKNRLTLTNKEYQAYQLKKGDLLFARRSLVFEGSGKCSIVDNLPEPHVFESSIIRVIPNTSIVEPLFAMLSLNSNSGRYQILSITKQVTISGIDSQGLKDILLPLPSLDEQRIIIKELNRKTSKIDELISEEHQKIQHLKQYRQSLISEVVTGKIDVRSEA